MNLLEFVLNISADPARGRVQAKERPAWAHTRERNGQNDEELMDNVMRPRDEEGCILFCILYTKWWIIFGPWMMEIQLFKV